MQRILLSVGRAQQIGCGVEPKPSRDQCENDFRSSVQRYPPFAVRRHNKKPPEINPGAFNATGVFEKPA